MAGSSASRTSKGMSGGTPACSPGPRAAAAGRTRPVVAAGRRPGHEAPNCHKEGDDRGEQDRSATAAATVIVSRRRRLIWALSGRIRPRAPSGSAAARPPSSVFREGNPRRRRASSTPPRSHNPRRPRRSGSEKTWRGWRMSTSRRENSVRVRSKGSPRGTPRVRRDPSQVREPKDRLVTPGSDRRRAHAACEELSQREGLHQIVVSARVEPCHPVVDRVARSEHQHRGPIPILRSRLQTSKPSGSGIERRGRRIPGARRALERARPSSAIGDLVALERQGREPETRAHRARRRQPGSKSWSNHRARPTRAAAGFEPDAILRVLRKEVATRLEHALEALRRLLLRNEGLGRLDAVLSMQSWNSALGVLTRSEQCRLRPIRLVVGSGAREGDHQSHDKPSARAEVPPTAIDAPGSSGRPP